MSISFIYQRSAFYLEPETSPPVGHWKNCSLWYCYIVWTLQIQRIWPSLYTVHCVLSRKLDCFFFGSSNKKRIHILLFKSVNNIIYNFLISWTDSSTVLDCSRRWQSLFCSAALLSYKAVAAALQLLQVLV